MNDPLNRCLREFFVVYLRRQRALSPNTIKSYRDAFKFLLAFTARRNKTVPTLRNLDAKTILAFLCDAEERGNGAHTRNQRLAAIQSFFKYLGIHRPAFKRQAELVRAIPMKRALVKAVESLTRGELEALLAQPRIDTADGVRDLAILTFLYNTGARAQEAADARLCWFDFPQKTVDILGKGSKRRITPLWPATIRLLQLYCDRHRRKPATDASGLLFINQRCGPFTRFGIRAIVKKYLRLASASCPSLAKKRLSTHSLRHTCAVHLLESRVDPNVIKSWLGHASISSTSRYLDTDLNHKRRILEKFGPPSYVESSSLPEKAEMTDTLLDWLRAL